jgi:hypothetical protein
MNINRLLVFQAQATDRIHYVVPAACAAATLTVSDEVPPRYSVSFVTDGPTFETEVFDTEAEAQAIIDEWVSKL